VAAVTPGGSSKHPVAAVTPGGSNDLLKHVGVNLECINKSYCFLDSFVDCLLQRCSGQLSRRKLLISANNTVTLAQVEVGIITVSIIDLHKERRQTERPLPVIYPP
jgi:hypothetical protein